MQDPNIQLAILSKIYKTKGKLESRIHGNVYVRFGGEISETWHGDVLRRTVLTLLWLSGGRGFRGGGGAPSPECRYAALDRLARNGV